MPSPLPPPRLAARMKDARTKMRGATKGAMARVMARYKHDGESSQNAPTTLRENIAADVEKVKTRSR